MLASDVAQINDVAELAPIRESTTARLKDLNDAAAKDKSASARSKPLRDALNERLAWIDELRKAIKDRQTAENPKINPARGRRTQGGDRARRSRLGTSGQAARRALARGVSQPGGQIDRRGAQGDEGGDRRCRG